MEWRDRKGNKISDGDEQIPSLQALYETRVGRIFLPIMIRPFLSKLAGCLLSTPFSALAIPSFIKKNEIDLREYKKKRYVSFNDFFTREIREECRPIDFTEKHLIAPCDSKLLAYPIRESMEFEIKGKIYTMESLVRNSKVAEMFAGGTLLIFRLTVSDYHRYCYPDSGTKTKNIHIPGVYYTVNPIAYRRYSVLEENTREYCILHSRNFGDMLMMEVGATMVGKISNLHQEAVVHRGQEKGHFDFGGSTIVLCLRKDALQLDEDIWKNTKEGAETVVKYGQRIGTTARS